MIDRDFFFSQTRRVLFDGRLGQPQVDGLNLILACWDATHRADDPRWLAYILATAHHETGRTLRPIREYGSDLYLTRRYDPPPSGQKPEIAHALGNTRPGDGLRYCGRGFVQLTGRRNYADWADRLGLPLLDEPALANDPGVAAGILIEGAILGTFTGHALGHHIAPNRPPDWQAARRVINGTDRADLIAGYALAYYAAIRPAA